VAIDAKTGARLRMLKVYDVADHSAAGVSSPGRSFRSMTLVPGRDELAIEDETGGRYAVDVANRTVRIVSEPKAAATPRGRNVPSRDNSTSGPGAEASSSSSTERRAIGRQWHRSGRPR
jgi:hypothetical protein